MAKRETPPKQGKTRYLPGERLFSYSGNLDSA